MNSKSYRDIVLTYVEKLEEIDKLENQLTKPQGETYELEEKVNKLKKEVEKLKKEINNCKRKK